MSDSKPVIAYPDPYALDLEPGDYYWCACGRSASQPFCDGSHRDSEFEPIKLTIGERDGRVWLCGCKRSKRAPHCDGTHNRS